MPWFILRLLELKERILSVTKKHSHGKLRTSVIFVFSFFSFFLASPVHAETPSPLAVDGILLFFAEFAFSIAGALMKFIVVLIDAMIPIMTFNRFVDNPVVKNGWAIMRDTVNMFFVIVLIIIAFGTIFGNSRFKWQQQVPRLLIFAIVINFSKTICGIMIDFGQVIMLTFANALKEVAAGNFIKTLGLDKIYSVSVNQSAIKDLGSASAANPNQSFDFFAAGVMSVVLIMWVLATLIILVAILLYRIIMLWVLVVMAPLAWFMGGVAGKDGVFSSNAYADWWNEFKCMVAVGPVLVFFLWLTLVVAGSGNIAAEANFDVPAASNNASFASSLLELNHFLSFIIAMAMLMAGFKAATQMCSAVQGKFIGQALGAGQSGALVKSAIGFSAKGGSLGLRAGAKGAVAGYGLAGSGMRKIAPSGLVNAPGNLGRYVKGGAAGVGAKVFGNSAAGQYFKGKQMDTQQAGRAVRFESLDKEKEVIKGKDSNWKQARIESMLKNPPTSDAGKAQMSALFEDVMGDKRLQKQLKPETVQELWDKQGKDYGTMVEDHPEKKAAYDAFRKSNAHITGAMGDNKLTWDADDAKGLHADAWRDDTVRSKMGSIATTIKKDGGGTLTALEAAQAGHYGDAAQNSVVASSKVEQMNVGDEMESHMQAALMSGNEKKQNEVITSVADRYKTATPEDRRKMDASMERMKNSMAKRHGEGTAKTAFETFNTARAGVEAVGLAPPPMLGEGENVNQFVNDNFAGASTERVAHSIGAYASQESDIEKEIANLEKEGGAVQAGVAAKRQQIAVVRARIQAGVKKEVDGAQADLEAAQRGVESAKNKVTPGDKNSQQELKAAQKDLKKKQKNYTAAVKVGASQMKNDPEITKLETEIEAELATTQSEASVRENQERAKQVQNKKSELERLQTARKRLAKEQKS